MSDANYKSSLLLNYQRSVMTVTSRSSCWCIVSVFASHQQAQQLQAIAFGSSKTLCVLLGASGFRCLRVIPLSRPHSSLRHCMAPRPHLQAAAIAA